MEAIDEHNRVRGRDVLERQGREQRETDHATNGDERQWENILSPRLRLTKCKKEYRAQQRGYYRACRCEEHRGEVRNGDAGGWQ